jgi:hypothetical protein
MVKCLDLENRFNGLPHPTETVETVPVFPRPISTQLNQGVKERGILASSFDYEIVRNPFTNPIRFEIHPATAGILTSE